MNRNRVGALALAALVWVAGQARSATITVTSAADTHTDGQCTLREALIAANTNSASGATAGDCVAGDAGADTIAFAILPAGLHTIQPHSQLPAITEALTIDGYTQPASGGGTARPNTLPAGSDALLLIELDGSALPQPSSGGMLKVAAGPTRISGLVLNRASGSDGVGLQLTAGVSTVSGNYIGTDPSGMLARGNGCNGVRVFSSGNTIGGTTPAARNVIAATGGCAINLVLLGNDNVVQGNFIGTNAAGTAALGGIGVDVVGTGNLVGGTTPAQGNLISGNGTGGIRIFGSGSAGNTVAGNLIGLDVTGAAPLPNLYGIAVLEGAHDNLVGGDSAAAGNTIAFNTGSGVAIASDAGSGNAILSNLFSENGGLGIDLGNDGPTPNDDDGDSDSGPNGLQNFPVLTSVSAGSVEGTLTGEPDTDFKLQFFANTTCDPTGFGEAQTLIGFGAATTDASGHASFGTSLTVPPGQAVTATATDAAGNTSELSLCVLLTPSALAVDAAVTASSDGNGVLEPGETVGVEPFWSNLTGTEVVATGHAGTYSGPAGPIYALTAVNADYSTIAAGAIGGCAVSASCYAASVSSPASRPGTHWDSWFTETLDVPNAPKLWMLHVGESFSDVARTDVFYRKIETALHHGITVGCTATQYCPSQKVRRDQMAIFLARAIAQGAAHVPTSGSVGALPYDCAPGGTSIFADVPPGDAACKSVHFIASQNVTAGCAPSLYCPETTVTRAEMSIFVARAIVAPGGGASVPLTYGPDPVTGSSYSCSAGSPKLHFSDVAVSDAFCKHAHYLWARGVIGGCSATQYCPTGEVGRGEMAKFLSNAFDLKLYGP